MMISTTEYTRVFYFQNSLASYPIRVPMEAVYMYSYHPPSSHWGTGYQWKKWPGTRHLPKRYTPIPSPPLHLSLRNRVPAEVEFPVEATPGHVGSRDVLECVVTNHVYYRTHYRSSEMQTTKKSYNLAIDVFKYSFTFSFIHLFVCSFICSFIHWLIRINSFFIKPSEQSFLVHGWKGRRFLISQVSHFSFM